MDVTQIKECNDYPTFYRYIVNEFQGDVKVGFHGKAYDKYDNLIAVVNRKRARKAK